MRKYLLPQNTKFFKANLHCHTNISDGKETPEEIKQLYSQKGYSVVAFTDHEILIPHPELNDENFLALNSYEYEIISPRKPDNPAHKLRKTCHMCLIALEPDNTTHVCWHGGLWGNALNYLDQAKIREDEPLFIRHYNGECISHVMREARKAGFFVTYNHPVWSMEDMADIANYHGMNALEIFNTGCAVGGWDEYNNTVYDAMLRRGEKIFCIAADDNHDVSNMFGGWTMIAADKLEYRNITKALEDGNFYASTGPEIHALWFEDGKLHIECSPAARIVATHGSRIIRQYKAKDAPLTEAVIPVGTDDIYIRVTVYDQKGEHADTNAYFIEDLYR